MEENIFFDKDAPLNMDEQEFYDMAVLTKQALVGRMSDEEMKMPDIKDELKRIEVDDIQRTTEERHSDIKPIKYHPWWRNLAAAFIGMAVLGSVAVAGIYMQEGSLWKTDEKSDTIKTVQSTVATPEEPQEIVFDETPLSEMMQVIAKHYGVKLVFEDEEVKSIRMFYTFDKSKPLEKVVRNLNHFNKINVAYEEGTIKISRR